MSPVSLDVVLMQMEAWLDDPTWVPVPDDLTVWNEQLVPAMVRLEANPERDTLRQRCHVLGQRLEMRADRLAIQQGDLKAIIEGQTLGFRALKGYGASLQA